MKTLLLSLCLFCATAGLRADFDSGPFLDLGAAGIVLGGDDLSRAGRNFDAQAAPWGMATVGWLVENGVEVGVSYSVGPGRRVFSNDGVEDWDLSQGWLAASAGWNLALGYGAMAGLRLSGGPVWLNGTNRSRAAGELPEVEVHASAASAWLPELKIEALYGQIGIQASAGWLFARFDEVRGAVPGGGKKALLYHADGSSVRLDQGGPVLRLALRLYFEKPL